MENCVQFYFRAIFKSLKLRYKNLSQFYIELMLHGLQNAYVKFILFLIYFFCKKKYSTFGLDLS